MNLVMNQEETLMTVTPEVTVDDGIHIDWTKTLAYNIIQLTASKNILRTY